MEMKLREEGLKKTNQGQDLQECGQLRQSLDALNHRTTVNHSPEGTSQATRRRSASFTVSPFQGQRKQSTRSLLWPAPALGTECNTNQSKKEALCWVLEDR